MNPLIVIPARLASTRLPDKPLADIAGEPMIVHVWRRAVEAAIGPVLVACADAPIAEAIEAVGGQAVVTTGDHASGSDRIHEAAETHDPGGAHDVVVNIQGDLPLLDPASIRAVLAGLRETGADIATLVAPITEADEMSDPHAVKAVVEMGEGAQQGRAVYFSRAGVPHGVAPPAAGAWHHIGLYAFRRPALRRFVALPPSMLEKCERLEQLRALADGMHLQAVRVETIPWGVDAPADLARVRQVMTSRTTGEGSP